MADVSSRALQYAPFNSCVHPGFWSTLTKVKLEVLGLDEEPIEATATFLNSDADGLPSRLSVEWDSIKPNLLKTQSENVDKSEVVKSPWNSFKCTGRITNLNTIDGFKSLDKNGFLAKEACVVWEAINDGRALKTPDDYLNRFSVLMYADLKRYHYYYWFAFPAFVLPKQLKMISFENSTGHTSSDSDKCWMKRLDHIYSEESCQILSEEYQTWRKKDENQKSSAFFCFNIEQRSEGGSSNNSRPNVTFKTLEDGLKEEHYVIAFADPCTLESHPGWPLRNLLLLLTKYCPERLEKGLNVMCFRQKIVKGDSGSPNKITVANSLMLRVCLNSDGEKSENCSESLATILEQQFKQPPSAVGWEKNEKGTGYGPRMANLRSTMDPSHLAASSVDLNLKLMKWRLLPDLDLEKIRKTRCLLLGSGTLGCNVARCLLGWGIRHITFVDNGKVSYSNPVRQSLFTFDDCLNGGRDKALAAAEAMTKIFPAVTTKAVTLTVPMPAHTISASTEAEVKRQYNELEELIKSHDVIYLLMDTRESRWLPTVMAAHHDKLVINSALGFDSYLVMRHGMPKQRQEKGDTPITKTMLVPGDQLGCYFCNDVVAPGNSTRDRTLDQQCTVTRPGVSYMAASLAVELMVSTLQHAKGSLAPAPTFQNMTPEEDNAMTTEAEGLLGSIVPHSIRGSLHTLTQFLPTTHAFNHCTACSPNILKTFAEKGFDFIKEVANTGGSEYLEKVAGLENLMSEINMDDIEADFDLESDDSV